MRHQVRPNGHNEERSPTQLGVMAPVRMRTGGFTEVVDLLIKRGLLSKYKMAEGYGLWQRVKADAEVQKRSMVMAARNRPHEVPSVHAVHSYALKVVVAMSAAEVKALKLRLGI